jgi:hypothetical protein
MPDPARPFCGREAELAELERLWMEVRDGGGPRVAVLLAEAGLGKTRLVQEFYRRVVAEGGGDAERYWPSLLGVEGENLLVHPPAGSWNAAAPMPLLWWGVRLADPLGENHAAAGALAAAVERDLLPHLDALHREQRRRARRAEALRTGGSLLADVAADLVPFASLLKSMGQAGAAWRQLAADDRRDRAAVDATAQVQGRQRSLIERVLGDLDALLGGPFEARVPAVLLIDDAQFSHHDPGLVAFVEALLPAMAEGGWPLLLLVTHWEREWFAPAATGPGPGTVAQALQGWGGNDLHVLRLAPIADLSPVVRAALPGLPQAQSGVVLERAGGHPRLLDELLRYLADVRRRPLFERRDPAGALTAAGLAALRALSVDVHERVAARLAEAPDDVQRAVAIAAAQGTAFLPAVVASTAAALAEAARDDVAAALDAAQRPHAFVARTSPAVAAFTQRVHFEVAREFLPGLVDAEEAGRALASAVRAAAQAGADRFLDDPLDRERFDALVAATFEDAVDVEDLRLAAMALTGMAGDAERRGDAHAAAAFAGRLAVVVARIPDERLDPDLDWLHTAIGGLGLAGDHEGQRGPLLRLLGLTAATFEEARDDPEGDGTVEPWTGWMVASAAVRVGDWHLADGSRDGAQDAYGYAHAALASIAQRRLDGVEVVVAPGAAESAEAAHAERADDPDPEVLAALSTAATVARRLGGWARDRGAFDEAMAYYDHALELRARLERLDPGPWRSLQRGEAWRLRNGLALERDPHAADAGAWSALAAEQRALAATEVGTAAEDALADTLVRVGEVAFLRDDAATMRAAGDELVALRRRRLAAADVPDRRLELASALRRRATIAVRTDDLDGAWAASTEGLGLVRPLIGARGLASAREEAVLALTLASQLAALRRDVEPGRTLADEALALARAELERDDAEPAPVPVVGRWLGALLAAAPYAAADGPAAGHALLDEADAAYGRLPVSVRWSAEPSMAMLDELRAKLSDAAGEAEAAEAARGRAAARVAAFEARFEAPGLGR